MTSFNDTTGGKRVLCCRNCRKLYRDAKDGKYRCAITHGQVLPNTICEECIDANIAVMIKDLLPTVNARYYRKIYRRKHDSE